ncbi:alcohol dehydrogenase-like [Spodoptera litura]|uniref:15-hydroxyprostaglandin dehydrogenase [NAD(+)] n=1 Tax=Spodoptera litura TaxID=69820 RepID=A0A9J7EAN7_SPOLT|nr:alcohol dehydrogenase-like [Spodoptera litura]
MAVLHFSQCIAMPPFFENTGVRVLALCLGPTDTALLENLAPKAYDLKVGQFMMAFVESQNVVYQKPESAVKVLVDMYKTGPPASFWLSLDNKPGQNITPTIDRAFKDFENLLMPSKLKLETSEGDCTYFLKMAKWEVQGKTFLITGGASGLGALYAETFLKNGAKSVALLDIAVETGKATTERLNNTFGNKVIFLKCDVSKEEDIVSAWDAVLAQFKQIDVIINNAGIMVDTPNMWRTASDVNWQGLVSFSLKGISHMRKDEGGAGGTIINISSTAALGKPGALPVYSGSKMAVLHFGQCLTMEPFYDLTGIRILTKCLGATDTPLLHNLDARAYDPKAGKALVETVKTDGVIFQKPESAAAASLYMFQNGAPGSVWLVNNNNPAKDITPVIDSAYAAFEKVMME